MTVTSSADAAREQLQNALVELGFSVYEARCYTGLVGNSGLTGYGVSKATGVPQPKVYENLRRLVRRGAARQLGTDPVLFVATPPSEVLSLLDSEFRGRYGAANEAATAIEAEGDGPSVISLTSFASRDAVVRAAQSALDGAERRVYLSCSAAEVTDLLPTLRAAVARGVDIVLLDFGPERTEEEGMRVFRHASTERALFRHHQARHVALVADSAQAINAIAVDGESWEGVQTGNASIIAAVKGMIRHDIDIQQIYADFRAQLVEAYGPGLQALETYRAPAASAPAVAAGEPEEAPRPGRRRQA